MRHSLYHRTACTKSTILTPDPRRYLIQAQYQRSTILRVRGLSPPLVNEPRVGIVVNGDFLPSPLLRNPVAHRKIIGTAVRVRYTAYRPPSAVAVGRTDHFGISGLTRGIALKLTLLLALKRVCVNNSHALIVYYASKYKRI